MHNGMLRFTGEKMSKSLGNVAGLRETVEEWGRETLLVFFLTAHWRKPIDFSEETLASAKAQAEGFRNAFRLGAHAGAGEGEWSRLEQALEEDFSTPEALAVLHDWRAQGGLHLLRRGLAVFGLESLAELEEAPPEAFALARRRGEARAAKDFALADRLRDQLGELGWEIRDVAEPPGFQLVRR
jgi:cysteinyl-tRNA synthetase